MWRAVLHKELRETLWIAGVGLLAYIFALGTQQGIWWLRYGGGNEIPFLAKEFLPAFCLVAVPLAIVLGLWQSVLESGRGTWLFLLHRPMARAELIGLKLATGAGLYLVCTAVALLAFAWWAATPGTHASPFEWSMTLVAWQTWLAIAAMYFAAFLSGIRPARWIGSRLLPLPATGILIALIQTLPWSWLPALAANLILDAWLIATILYVARTRDF